MEYPIFCRAHNSPIALVNLNKEKVNNRLICFQCLENPCQWCPIENFIENPLKILKDFTHNINQEQLFELINKFENQIVEEYLEVEKNIQKLLLNIRRSIKINLQTLKDIKSQVQTKKKILSEELELNLIVTSIKALQSDKNEEFILKTVTEKLNEIFDQKGQKLQRSLQNFELSMDIKDNKIEQFNQVNEKIQKDLHLIKKEFSNMEEKVSSCFYYFQKY